MRCCFCDKKMEGRPAGVLVLCPECEARMLGVSPLRPEYPWFVAAVRRALFERAGTEQSAVKNFGF